VEAHVVARARVVFSTVSSSARSVLAGEHFPTVIVDEAAMCEEALSFVILRPEATRLVLVGDPKQLPATVLSAAAQRAGFSRSMMDRLIVNGCAAVLLNVQHRMHPDVAKWPNEQFYEGRL
ncbi:AAA domain-containing protein, partial [Pelagophyceae sp. CCMP2097]